MPGPTPPVTAGPRVSATVVAAPDATGFCPCGGGCPRCRGGRVHLTRPGDPAELQAESAARRVMRISAAAPPPRARRLAGEPVEPALPSVVGRPLRSRGQALDQEMRAFMEARFDRDFSLVRTHVDDEAAAAARALGARAYAVGTHIVFGAGQYRPATHAGRELIAHELAHIVAPAVAPDGAPVAHRQPDATATADPPSDFAIFLTLRRPDDVRFARRLGRKDARDLRRAGKLSRVDRQVLDAKLGFFTGHAKEVYVREIKPALLQAVPPDEITMPAAYVGRPAPPEDVLNAIMAILQGALPGADRAQPGNIARFKPDYYLRRDPAMRPHADLLRDWYEIAHEWVKAPDPLHPNLVRGVSGDIALTRIRMAVKKTAPLVANVAAASPSRDVMRFHMMESPNEYFAGQRVSGAELIMRYNGMVDWLTSRAQQEVKDARHSAAEAAVRARIYKMNSQQIHDQWKNLKAKFVSIASSPDNRLSTRQLFDIWRWYWIDRREDGNRRVREIEHALAAEDIQKYMREMSDFQDGDLDALGPEYRRARTEAVTGAMMVGWAPEIRAMVFDGKTRTLQAANQKALVVAKNWQQLAHTASGISAYYGARAVVAADETLAMGLTSVPDPTGLAPEPPPQSGPPAAPAGAADIPYRPGGPLDDTQPVMAFEDTKPGGSPPADGGGGAGGGPRSGDTIVSYPPPMPRPAGRGPTGGTVADAGGAASDATLADSDPYLELLRLKNERVGEYAIKGSKAKVGNVFVRRILVLQRVKGATSDVRPLLRLFQEFEAEARAAGATELRVTGLAVKNPNVMRMNRIGDLLGARIRQIDAHTIEVTISLGEPVNVSGRPGILPCPPIAHEPR